jgi:hypothetical protein
MIQGIWAPCVERRARVTLRVKYEVELERLPAHRCLLVWGGVCEMGYARGC